MKQDVIVSLFVETETDDEFVPITVEVTSTKDGYGTGDSPTLYECEIVDSSGIELSDNQIKIVHEKAIEELR